MGRGRGTQLRLVQRFPLAARPEDVDHGISTAPVRDTGPPSPEAMRMHGYRQQGGQHVPQVIGETETRRGAVIWVLTRVRFVIVRVWCVCMAPSISVIRIGSKAVGAVLDDTPSP